MNEKFPSGSESGLGRDEKGIPNEWDDMASNEQLARDIDNRAREAYQQEIDSEEEEIANLYPGEYDDQLRKNMDSDQKGDVETAESNPEKDFE